MKITILGTSGSIITLKRDPVSILIDNSILIDCAEGTTKKLLKMGGILGKLKKILISHVHTDHFIGLISLLWHLWIGEGRTKPMHVYGPEGIGDTMSTLFEITRTPLYDFSYKIRYHEFKGKSIERIEDISTLRVRHGIPTLAYRIDGEKSLCYSGDTSPIKAMIDLAKDCDVLIHEASGPSAYSEWLHQYHHSSSVDAARIAQQANVKILIPLHFLPNVKDPEAEMRKEIEKIFHGKVLFPEDLQTIRI